MNAKLGIDHILYDGQNSNVSSNSDDTDWWGYEALLWLNMAQSLREDRWSPSAGATLPPEVQSVVDSANAAGVNLIPYIYPILGWHTADPAWRQNPADKNSFCTLEHQDYDEFYVDTIAAFSAISGARGAGFDFTYFINSNASNYAQWYVRNRVRARASARARASEH